MERSTQSSVLSAIEEFKNARRKANINAVFSRLTGSRNELLSFEDVSRQLKARQGNRKELLEIPLDGIVGSVGRYKDFDRNFLPTQDSDRSRWTRVRLAVESPLGVPPIEVYQIGEMYFVLDGNHRVSIARQSGQKSIQGYVTKFHTPVDIRPDDDMNAVILKAEYAYFLEKTHLDQLFPDLSFKVTAPGRFQDLYEHIDVHRYYMGLERQDDVPYEEAVESWVESVYLPVIRAIRRGGILRDFPDRTETDLYLWLLRHRSQLEESLGWQLNPEEAALHLHSKNKDSFWQKLFTFSQDIIGIFFPVKSHAQTRFVEDGDSPADVMGSLFRSILVPLSRADEDWQALNQAILIAKKENATIRGLIVQAEDEEPECEDRECQKQEFLERCEKAGVEAEVVMEVRENIAEAILERAIWNDLVILHLFRPPEDEPISRLRSGLREVVSRCPRPLLLVPNASQMQKFLLAFDNSPKAREALYLATYLMRNWGVRLYVVCNTDRFSTRLRSEAAARRYLRKYNLRAKFINRREEEPAKVISVIANESDVDAILMGGYSRGTLGQVMVGSTVDHVMREYKKPIFITR